MSTLNKRFRRINIILLSDSYCHVTIVKHLSKLQENNIVKWFVIVKFSINSNLRALISTQWAIVRLFLEFCKLLFSTLWFAVLILIIISSSSSSSSSRSASALVLLALILIIVIITMYMNIPTHRKQGIPCQNATCGVTTSVVSSQGGLAAAPQAAAVSHRQQSFILNK